MTYQVRDGMFTVEFKGELIAEHDTFLKLPPEVNWDEISVSDAKSYLRWVEMELYRVAPGQEDDPDKDPGEQIRLPDGGYIYHIGRQTICYHRHEAPHRYQGVPKLAGSTDTQLLPCRECQPPLIWDPWPEDADHVQLLCDPKLVVDVEPVRHETFRDETIRGIIGKIHGKFLTVPANLLLEKAVDADPQVRAVFARPRPARAVS